MTEPATDAQAATLFDETFNTSSPTWNYARIRQRIIDTAQQYKVDPALALATGHQESQFNPEAVGDDGEGLGLFQLHAGAAKDAGVPVQYRQEPGWNIEGGVKYLRLKLDQAGGDPVKALQLYNGRGDPDYAAHVMQYYPGHAATLQQSPQPAWWQRATPALTPASAEAAAQPAAPRPATDAEAATLFQTVFGTPTAPAAPSASAPPPAAQGLPLDTQVMPNPDPTQPATLAYPGSSPAMTPPSGVLQPPIDIEKPSPETPPAQAPAAQTALTPDLGDAEILRRIGVDPDLVMKSRFYQPGRFAKEIPQPGSSREGIDTSWVGGFGRGVQRVGEGPAQWVMHKAGQLGLLAPEDVALNDALVKLHEVVYQQQEHPTWTPPLVGKVTGPIDIPATVGQTAALPNVTPLPLKEAGSFLGNVARGVVNSTATGAVAGATQPVYEPGVPGTADDDYDRQKWQQSKQGGKAGAVAGAITSTASAAGNKVVNAARNLSPRYAQVQRALDAATDPSGAVNENIFTAALRTETGGKVSGVEKWQADGMQKWMQHIQTVNKVSAGVGKAMETGAIILPHWLTVAGFSMKKVVDVLYNTPAGRNFLIAASDLQPGSGAMSRLWDTMAAQLPRLAAVHTTQDTIEGQQP